MLGVSRERVNRQLVAWANSGILSSVGAVWSSEPYTPWNTLWPAEFEAPRWLKPLGLSPRPFQVPDSLWLHAGL